MIFIAFTTDYSWQAHKPNTILDTIVSADNCSSTTIGCGAVAQLEVNHHSCAATKQQVEQVEMKIEEVIASIENLADKVVDLSKINNL